MWSLSLLCSVSRLLLYSPDVSNTWSLTFIRTSGLPWSIKLNETHSPGERGLTCLHCDLKPLPSLEEYALWFRKKDKGQKERSWPAEPSIDLVSHSDPHRITRINHWLLVQHLGVTCYIAKANIHETRGLHFPPLLFIHVGDVILSATANRQCPLDSAGIFQINWELSFQSD